MPESLSLLLISFASASSSLLEQSLISISMYPRKNAFASLLSFFLGQFGAMCPISPHA